MKDKIKKLQNIQISEKGRTIILVVLLCIAVGFIYWTKNSYDTNFVDGF
jgi:uncharacterized membrane protein YhfC